MRLTASLPPPPTPMTRMSAKFGVSSAAWMVSSGSMVGLREPNGSPPCMAWVGPALATRCHARGREYSPGQGQRTFDGSPRGGRWSGGRRAERRAGRVPAVAGGGGGGGRWASRPHARRESGRRPCHTAVSSMFRPAHGTREAVRRRLAPPRPRTEHSAPNTPCRTDAAIRPDRSMNRAAERGARHSVQPRGTPECPHVGHQARVTAAPRRDHAHTG